PGMAKTHSKITAAACTTSLIFSSLYPRLRVAHGASLSRVRRQDTTVCKALCPSAKARATALVTHRLAQDEEPGGAGGEARGRRGLGTFTGSSAARLCPPARAAILLAHRGAH